MQPARNLREIIPAFFTGPSGERLTPDQIKQRQEVAQSLLARATDTRPDAGGWASVLTKGLLGYQSGRDQRRADEATRANAEANQTLMNTMLGSLGGGGAAYPAPIAMGASPTSGAPTTGGVATVPSAPEIRQGLIDRGLPEHVADAFIVNFQDESGLNPGINERNPIVPGSRGGFGLYQLTGPRRRQYEAFAAERGLPLDSVDAQLDFLMQEGSTTEKEAFDKILSSPDTASAAQAIVNNFLRPAPEHRRSRASRYAKLANTTAQQAIQDIAPIEQGDENPMVNMPVMPEGTPYVDPLVAPYDGTGSRVFDVTNMPEISTAPDMQFDQENFDQRFGAPAPVPAPEPAIDENLLAQHDAMWGGALSPYGVFPVAQALMGYFPDAPSADRAPVVPQGGGINPAVIQALSDPYASPETRQVASMLLGQQIQQNDPKRALELQKLQAEVGMLQQGRPGANSAFGNLDAQARAAGLQPGTPEYQQFMLNGGGAPATFRALDMQAQAAGFQPGTPEYNEFMATRGAGLQAGAAQTAKNVANIDTGGAAAGAVKLGEESIKAGTEAWSDYGKLQTSIGNIDEAIAALDNGARAGIIDNYLPNITEASASLKNALDRMGLDVIGSVTFGALSEGEMRLAMQTAAPRDLSPQELRKWLTRKREAQIKAADMLADAAQYLTKPGNTINGWIERNKELKKQQQESDGGEWRDMGNGVRMRMRGN